MSTTETAPDWQDCPAGPRNAVPGVLALPPKQVALGTSPEALTVRRTLPQLTRSFVGAWCFVDHYGPGAAGMDVPPHPHTSLQTVSWLFSGEIEHRDSSGAHALVRPGEVNLMTGGAGIAHSEVSTPATTLLHGVQLWVVLPQVDAGIARDFQHHRPDVIEEEGLRARVFLGALGGDASPVVTRTPLLGAEVVLAPGKVWEVEVDPGFEHGVLVDAGVVRFDGTPLDNAVLGVRDAGLGHLRLENPHRRARPRPAPRRHALRRGHRDVVELHRPQPRRGGRARR